MSLMTINSKRKTIQAADNVAMRIVFIATAICVWSNITATVLPIPDLTHVKFYPHRDFWFPLQANCMQLLLCYLLLWKAYKFDCCLLTKVATWLFITLTAIYISVPIAAILKIDISFYYIIVNVSSWVCIIGISILSIIYFIRLCLLKFGK